MFAFIGRALFYSMPEKGQLFHAFHRNVITQKNAPGNAKSQTFCPEMTTRQKGSTSKPLTFLSALSVLKG